MSNLIENWRKQKDSHLPHQKKLLKKLKRHKGKSLDKFAVQVHEEVFEQLDCLDCANCCTGIPPLVNSTDVNRIAKKLGLSNAKFEAQYLTIDEDGDQVMNQSPCPFLLADKHCSIYEFRPKACRTYPHTDEQFSSNLNYHVTNTQYCPATFHILERLKNAIP
jgi:Fe-S-cluster containining protein